jgi:hypothetical protein
MRRWLMVACGVLAVGSGVWMGSRLVTEWTLIRSLDRDIQEQEDIIQKAREDGRALRKKIEDAKAAVKDTPDSSQAGLAGEVLRKAQGIAKAQDYLEENRIRAQRRVRYLKGERETASSAFARWGLRLAVVEAFLVGGIVIAVRFPRRSTRSGSA